MTFCFDAVKTVQHDDSAVAVMIVNNVFFIICLAMFSFPVAKIYRFCRIIMIL